MTTHPGAEAITSRPYRDDADFWRIRRGPHWPQAHNDVIQKLLRKVETGELAVALKAASEAVKEKVFRNMSARAGEMLREEIGDMGPVRMNDVSAAQQKITSIIQDMEFKGELIISGRRGEALVA